MRITRTAKTGFDTGLGGFLKSAVTLRTSGGPEWGKHTRSRPCAMWTCGRSRKFVQAYGHNGYFKSLEEIVHFYNTRDVPGAGWPPPEVVDNINTTEMGNLGLNHGRN